MSDTHRAEKKAARAYMKEHDCNYTTALRAVREQLYAVPEDEENNGDQ